MTSEVRTIINPVNCRFFNEPRKLAFTVGIHPGDEKGALPFAIGARNCATAVAGCLR